MYSLSKFNINFRKYTYFLSESQDIPDNVFIKKSEEASYFFANSSNVFPSN